MTDHLLRQYAPIPAKGWQQIDDEAKNRLTPRLAARRLVDWSGPHGWAYSATNLGRITAVETAPPGTKSETFLAQQRQVLPLIEFRVGFTVERSGVQDAERGASDVDYADLDRAAQDAALIENRAVFDGWPEAGITGILGSSSHPPVTLKQDAKTYPHAVAQATACFARPASKVPTPWPSARRDMPASRRQPSRATPYGNTSSRSSVETSCGLPAWTVPW